MVHIQISRLGKSAQEIDALEQVEGKWNKRARRAAIAMAETPLPGQADIDALEALVGPLHPEYREFQLAFNGGRPTPNVIVTATNELVVNFFFPLKHPPNYPNGLEACRETYGERIPRGMLPIASAGGGDLVLLRTAGEDAGKVFYWYHDLECDEDDASAYEENIEWLADSFHGLLASLRDPDETGAHGIAEHDNG